MRQDISTFFRTLRSDFGGRPIPYLWVPELHKKGDFHVHFAVSSEVRRNQIRTSWPHGFIHLPEVNDLPVGSGQVAEARKAAGYLAKYVGKAIDAEANGHRPFGCHRYDLAQGFLPAARRITGRTAGEVLDLACEQMGAQPSVVWNSDEVEDWRGAPALWLKWG